MPFCTSTNAVTLPAESVSNSILAPTIWSVNVVADSAASANAC
jgi:hypothetical protein